jgi:glyoxylase-like metal-dependent hydrolase (beta-lactamase superfamily II)
VVTGAWKTNCYLVSDEQGIAAVIDPGDDFAVIKQRLDEARLSVGAILCTHGHFDHVGAVADLQTAYGAPFHLHSADAKLLTHANLYRRLAGAHATVRTPTIDADLSAVTTLVVGLMTVQVLACPGHTPGGVAFRVSSHLFTGDTLMRNAVGRTDLPGGDAAQLSASVTELLQCAPETTVYPGHGSPFRLSELGGVAPHVQERHT